MLARHSDKNFLFLSGDRHISEFSEIHLTKNAPDKIVEFTSSGLTHSWSNFPGEKNRYRVNKVYSGKSFGVLNINWSENPILINLDSINRPNEINDEQPLSKHGHPEIEFSFLNLWWVYAESY